ncbi:PTS mannose/fructose/sorbose transporter subunit IIAB [Enterococcus sp. AZ163]|uniref:PTS mannose/fructose/sorbose transporter subunit IIAB n=1 Tax=Enterococcus sp. AZ163 TaxID=2774638 RepID=UPI003D2A7CAF
MRAIVFVGHGDLPKGMKHSIEMITGMKEHIFVVSLLPEDGKEEFQNKLATLDSQLTEYTEILVFADLLGGSPCNGVVERYFDNEKVQIAAGMNLPMAVTAVLGDLPIEQIIQEGKTGISNVKNPQQTGPVQTERHLTQSARAKSGEPFEVKNVRIDARGIHGQVATAWTPKLNIDRIMVIDDCAVKDEMQKMALKMAKPNSVKLSILSSKKAVERLSNKDSYPGEKLLVILQRVETLKKLAELGYRFADVNVGNVPNRPGTTSYRKTVHLTEEEVAIIKTLIHDGTHFTAQMVPNDAKVDFDEIINK